MLQHPPHVSQYQTCEKIHLVLTNKTLQMYKKICNGHSMSSPITKDKIFRIMKLTFIALFVFSFSVLSSIHSQTTRVSINANNLSTHSILEQIEQQTDYLFIYNTTIVR